MGCITSFFLSGRMTSHNVARKCEHHVTLMQNGMKHSQEYFIAQDAYIQTLRNVGIALEHFSKGIVTLVDVHSFPMLCSSLDLSQVVSNLSSSTQPQEYPYSINGLVAEESCRGPTAVLSAMGSGPSEFGSIHDVGHSTTEFFDRSFDNDLKHSSFLDMGESSPTYYSPRRDDFETGQEFKWMMESNEESQMDEEEYSDEVTRNSEDIEMMSCKDEPDNEWMPALEELEDIDSETQTQHQLAEEYSEEVLLNLDAIEMTSCKEDHEDEWMPALEELEDMDGEVQQQNQREVSPENRSMEKKPKLVEKEGMACCLRHLMRQKYQMDTPQESLFPSTQDREIHSSSNYLMNEVSAVENRTTMRAGNLITDMGKDILDSGQRQERFMFLEESMLEKNKASVWLINPSSEEELLLKPESSCVLETSHMSEEDRFNTNRATPSCLGLHKIGHASPPHPKLSQVLRCIVKQFERAYTSGQCVSNVIVSNNSYLTGSPVVFNAITAYWSTKTDPSMKFAFEENGTPSELGMAGSHAATLQLLHAWETKLYEEVKVAEDIQASFDVKCGRLCDLSAKDNGENKTMIEKLRIELKEIEAELFVSLNAIQVTSMKVESLANRELYSDLYQLLVWLRNMWKVMSECHYAQEKIVSEMEEFEAGLDDFSAAHNDATIKLERVLREWQDHFDFWFQFQKTYIFNLYAWSQMRYQVNDQSWNHKTSTSKMFWLLKEWKNMLVNLEFQHKEVVASIRNFDCSVHLLEQIQSHELRLQRHAEKSDRIINNQAFSFKILGTSGRSWGERTVLNDQKMSSLYLLKQHLPKVFRSLALFAETSWRKYEKINKKVAVDFVTNDG